MSDLTVDEVCKAFGVDLPDVARRGIELEREIERLERDLAEARADADILADIRFAVVGDRCVDEAPGGGWRTWRTCEPESERLYGTQREAMVAAWREYEGGDHDAA